MAMDRTKLYLSWLEYFKKRDYQGIGELASNLERRMRELARFPQRVIHGFVKRELESSMGMSLGVLKQLQWGLTSVSSGGRVRGGGRA